MVCIAAFIVLLLVGIFVAIISIFKKDFGKKYLRALKKAFHCFSKKVRLQKCDTNFSDDVKTVLLKKVVIKKPKLVKPLSITIEVASVLLVAITVWSIVEAAKAGLSLWVFGTCNVSQPSSCALGADSCGLDENDLNWFSEWGEIFSNIPDRLKNWDASAIEVTEAFRAGEGSEAALSIIDPGCSVCLQSYKNIMQDEEFLKKHKLSVVLYPIKNTDGSLRFSNSEIITRFSLAINKVMGEDTYSAKMMARIFTENNKEGDNYQGVLNNQLNEKEVLELLVAWVREWGLSCEKVREVEEMMNSSEITEIYEQNREVVENIVKPKGIPTMVYDGGKHLGLYKV